MTDIDRSYRDALRAAYTAWKIEREEAAANHSLAALEALVQPLGILLARDQRNRLMMEVEPMEDLATRDSQGTFWVWGVPVYLSDQPVIPNPAAVFDGRWVKMETSEESHVG